jgi:heme-degrading monooxygenase HmoA
MSMIVRVFRGRVWPGTQEEYARMLREEAVPQFRAHPGLVDIMVAEPIQPAGDEFLVISVWRSLADLRDFVGERWFEVKMMAPEAELLRSKSLQHYRASGEPVAAAQIPQRAAPIAEEVEAQGIRVSVGTGVLAFDGRTVELPPREVAALAGLLTRLGELVSGQELAMRIWPDEPFVDAVEARRVIHLLRGRLAAAEAPLRIRTRRGLGYVLEATESPSLAR